MAKDNRVVRSGAFTVDGVLTDPDEISEKLTAKEISSMVESGALEGDWQSVFTTPPNQKDDSQARLDSQSQEIADLKKQLAEATRPAEPTTAAVSPAAMLTSQDAPAFTPNKDKK